MTLDKEESRVLREIERWQAEPYRSGTVTAALDVIFNPLEKIVERVMPKKAVDRMSEPLVGVLGKLQTLSDSFVDFKAIVKKAGKAGLVVGDIEEFRTVPIAYLDALAGSLCGKNVLYGTLHGAGSGTLGGAFSVADLPVIFTLNLKMIFQIGACYGYRHASLWEREFALQIFCITSSSGIERDEQLRRMDELIDSFISGKFSRRNSILSSKEGTRVFISRILRYFIRKHVTRDLFLIGILLGSGASYLYTRDTAQCAYMFYRKRFLKEMAAGAWS